MPTDRSRQVYDFIRAYTARHGYAPKLREIGAQLGIRSRGVVHRHLRALEAEGLLRIEPDRARGIRLRGRALAAARPGQLPLLGRIAAGRPIEAIPGEDDIDLSEFFVNHNRFVLRVAGDSMIEDGILDGDMVVVEKRDSADNGEIVVALIDGVEATLKRLQKNRDGSVTLRPANATLPPMRYSAARVRIQGVVVGQFRSYR
ncbi:LexA family transcriptional regulator [Sulfuricaulis limicola]|uniref:LexA repressor n=1 Tax=Sulfuricaulis limicola TaxID=1620215 RepID=A0A1B4XCI0_9GAMM|nr:transcriptional repressor LexA [Sulfuricaulis limicola]BAV32518.1 LexA family transcriptional regulator [Sulfuricaulis limicola]